VLVIVGMLDGLLNGLEPFFVMEILTSERIAMHFCVLCNPVLCRKYLTTVVLIRDWVRIFDIPVSYIRVLVCSRSVNKRFLITFFLRIRARESHVVVRI
jgi:hypothetical protein